MYELYGREGSFSCGELLKVIGISVTRLMVELQSEGSKSITVNLSLDYPGGPETSKLYLECEINFFYGQMCTFMKHCNVD